MLFVSFEPVFREEVGDQSGSVRVPLWSIGEVTGHHPVWKGEKDGPRGQRRGLNRQCYLYQNLCFSASVMYQSKTAVSGKTLQRLTERSRP